MSFQKYGQTIKFPRNDDVSIHVREVTLNADAPESARVSAVEIREYLNEPQVYGHGIVLPVTAVRDLQSALERLGLEQRKSVGA